MTSTFERFATALLATSLAGAAALVAVAATPSAAPAAKAPARSRVIVVGWDGADWQLLDPLMAQGVMPNLKALVGEGRAARLETYRPRASPLLWTTLATGLSPLEHGVADFQEWDSVTQALVPISGRSRRGPAIWNVASARGLSVGVVGWWATWPAEVVKGFFVSDRASSVLFDALALSQSPALTWPPELAESVRLLGRREGLPPYEDVARFLKVSRAEFDAAAAERKELENPITGFRKILGSTRVYSRTALDLYDRKKPDLLMLYLEGTDEVGHVMARYHPPRLPSVSAEEADRYGQAVTLFYQEADRILGEVMRRARSDGAAVVLVSDHGFKWGADRPDLISSIGTETAYLWHDPYGILVMAGPGIAPARERGTAQVFDVVPILCRLLGLPPDPRMPGRVPPGTLAPAAPKPVPAVSWMKAFPVERAKIVRNVEAEKKAAEEFTKKLVSLGYLSAGAPPAVEKEKAGGVSADVRMTAHGLSNLGVFLSEQKREKEALPYFERAIAADPASASFRENLADALERLSRLEEADREAVKACALDTTNGTDRLMARVVRRVNARQIPSAVTLLERANRELTPPRPDLMDALGRLYVDERRCPEARPLFERLTAASPGDAGSWVMLARARRCLGETDGARQAYERALALAPSEQIRREAASLR